MPWPASMITPDPDENGLGSSAELGPRDWPSVVTCTTAGSDFSSPPAKLNTPLRASNGG